METLDFEKQQKETFISSPREDNGIDTWSKWMLVFFPAGFLCQLKGIMKLAWPILIVQLTQFTFPSVALMFCGHLGKFELDAVALANTAITVTGVTVTMGLLSACDTLFAQIFGSSNKKLAGVVLQRSFIITLLGLILTYTIHINIEAIFLAFGQHPLVSKLSGDYVFHFMPAMFFNVLYFTIVKYLNSQNVVYPSMFIGIISSGANILFHYIFIKQLNWGINGSAIAQDISYGIMAILNLCYLYFSRVYRYSWSGWTIDCFQEWGEFCYLALSGVVMICFEWWAFEIGTILAGTLGTIELGAQSILFQYDVIYYMFPMSISISTGIIVGQALGADDVIKAKTVARVGILCGTVVGAVAGILIIALKEYLPKLFTEDEDVIDMTRKVLPILGVYMTFSAIGNVSSGVVRGIGQQRIGAIICIINYGCSLIGGVTWMLMAQSIFGFWVSMSCMLLVCAVTYVIYLSCVNWDNMAQLALSRTRDNEDCYFEKTIIESVEKCQDKKENSLHDDVMIQSYLSNKVLAMRRIPVILAFLILFLSSLFFKIVYEVHIPENVTNYTLSTSSEMP